MSADSVKAEASSEGQSGASLIEVGPQLDRVREFLERACEADELDERLDLTDAPAALQGVSDALNNFLDKLWSQSFALAAKQEMLERTIQIRTNEVDEILDNVDTGFLLTLRDETVHDNYSRSCEAIFGTPDIKGKKLSELLGFDENERAVFSLSYEQIFEGFLPPEVSLVQLPSEFVVNGRTYTIVGTHIPDKSGGVAKVFFTINDTTELRKVEAENALRQALIDIVRQKDSFAAFLRETSKAFFDARRAPSQVRYRNLLHTLKGNLGCYGLHDIAELVHSIEDANTIAEAHLDTVEKALRKFLEAQRQVIGLEYPSPNQVSKRVELERLRLQLQKVLLEPTLVERQAALELLLHKSTWVEADALFAPVRGVFDRVVQRLEKVARLEVKGGQVLVDPERVSGVFSNLGHLIRNSLDHGIEPAFERGDKPECGHVYMECEESQYAWTIRVADDGRGIDVDALCEAAVAKGKITAEALDGLSWEQKARLLFLDGLSTKQVASMESGRGVGMSALLESVEAQGGSIDLMSASGEGTTVVITIPKALPTVDISHSRRPSSIHEPLGDRADISCSLVPPSRIRDSILTRD